jgi:hypothetical protein
MRTTVDLPDDLYRQAKAEAAAQGVKLREFIAAALEQALLKGSRPRPKKRVRLPLVKAHGTPLINPTREQLDASLWD